MLVVPHAQGHEHNGGQLQFDREGRLYVTIGDGASGGDPDHNAQNPELLLGKMLRIDPVESGSAPYTIPAFNPFEDDAGTRPEIWASGLRNPFRFSLDRVTGDLVIGDVGEHFSEELDYLPREQGTGAGANFGWPFCEGSYAFGVAPPPGPCGFTHTAPVHERLHETGDCSIIGGYVVRDPSLESLLGRYVYGDFCTGVLRVIDLGLPAATNDGPLGFDRPDFTVVSFGEDACGRLYLVQRDGGVWRLEDDTPQACTQPLPLPPGPADPPPDSGPR